ncbi:hypothetical protein EBN03_29895 [Nocardia stercoris]|uniref:Uncharacterized protein n=1 Tax=Nocardia stercoris TaxID=2483361 RepID=A0A3M2KVH0_9NOCA|nr:hypothetical protein EBN03_29895 [Nocardia stercoris]
MANTLTYSPRYNDFAILTYMPGHLAKTLDGFPGIRVDGVTSGKYPALQLRHLPTNSIISFRYVSHTLRGKLPASCHPVILSCKEVLLRPDRELTAREYDDLAAAPHMTSDVQILLSGLLARMRLAHPDKKWAVRELIWGRENRPDQDAGSFTYCWGTGDEWVVRWGGRSSVPATDVAQALTDPFAGVEGATARHFGSDRCEVRLGSARLRLEHRDVERGWEYDQLGMRP